jgi:hypothetical protein
MFAARLSSLSTFFFFTSAYSSLTDCLLSCIDFFSTTTICKKEKKHAAIVCSFLSNTLGLGLWAMYLLHVSAIYCYL